MYNISSPNTLHRCLKKITWGAVPLPFGNPKIQSTKVCYQMKEWLTMAFEEGSPTIIALIETIPLPSVI